MSNTTVASLHSRLVFSPTLDVQNVRVFALVVSLICCAALATAGSIVFEVCFGVFQKCFKLASKAEEHHCNRARMKVVGNVTQGVFFIIFCGLVFFFLPLCLSVSLGEASTNVFPRYHLRLINTEDIFLLLR